MKRRQCLLFPAESEARYDLPIFKEKPDIGIFWWKVSNLDAFNKFKNFKCGVNEIEYGCPLVRVITSALRGFWREIVPSPQDWAYLLSAWLTSGVISAGLLLSCRHAGPVKGYSVETSTNKSKDEFPALNR